MAFTVEEFHDLVQLLYERQDWRAELRRLILTDELLALPDLVRQIAVRLDQLTEHVDQLTEHVDQLTVRLDQLTERMDRLTIAQERTDAELDKLIKLTSRLDSAVGTLKGESLELRYARRAGVYFDDILRRATPVPSGIFADQLQDAMERGVLSPQERKDAIRLDLLVQGQSQRDKSDAYLAVEISSTIREKDVERAARRAQLLRRLYGTVTPVAAGEILTGEANERAGELGVQLILDGYASDPE